MEGHTIKIAEVEQINALVPLLLEVQALHVSALPERFRSLTIEAARRFFSEIFARPEARVFIAQDSDQVIGYAVAEIEESKGHDFCHPRRVVHVEQLVVAESFRGRGVARSLLLSVDSWAQDLGIDAVEMFTWAFNREARSAFSALGFEECTVKLMRKVQI